MKLSIIKCNLALNTSYFKHYSIFKTKKYIKIQKQKNFNYTITLNVSNSIEKFDRHTFNLKYFQRIFQTICFGCNIHVYNKAMVDQVRSSSSPGTLGGPMLKIETGIVFTQDEDKKSWLLILLLWGASDLRCAPSIFI